MRRELLVLLLALDLFLMGGSAYLLWRRARNFLPLKLFSSKSSAIVVPDQPVRQPEQSPSENIPEKPVNLNLSQDDEKPKKNRTETDSLRNILFRYRDSLPKRVTIVGDFNQWIPRLMNKDSNYNWTIILELKPGQYGYQFIVDGKTIRDPSNRKIIKKPNRKIPCSLLIVKPKD